MAGQSPLDKLRNLERLESEKAQEQARARQVGAGSSETFGNSSKKKGLFAVLVAIFFFIITKGKLILLFLITKGKLLLGALKLGPMMMTVSTMGLSVLAYGQFFGMYLAAGLVFLILIHEWGHGIAARMMGLKVSAPIFIPFFGAMIMMKEQPKSTWVEAVVGFGGPLAGTLGGACVLAAGLSMGPGYWRNLFLVTAWFTFMLNWFNMIPVFGLDGDRISQPFKFWYWIPGCGVVIGLAFASHAYMGNTHPFILFIILLGGIKGWRIWHRERQVAQGRVQERLVDRVTQTERYVEEGAVLPWQRRAAGFAYFVLMVILCVLLVYTDQIKPVLSRV